MFADRAKIYIKSGKGGDGHVSFRREKYVPNGGPDGGDGGDGGSVIFQVDEGMNTLTDFRHIRKYKAQDGQQGGKKNCRGKDGEDIIIKVPQGTVITDMDTGFIIADLTKKEDIDEDDIEETDNKKIFGNRKIALVREISKLYEEIIRDNQGCNLD